jgi:hypothetical protein
VSEARDPTAPVVKTGDTVTIALKHPSGLRLDLMGEIEIRKTPSGDEARAPLLKSYFVRGSSDERRLDSADDKGRPLDHAGVPQVRGGYGLTFGIPKDFWEAWLKQNADYPLVRNGLIFAAGANRAPGMAVEKNELKGSFEPLDPKGTAIGGVKFKPAYDDQAA